VGVDDTFIGLRPGKMNYLDIKFRRKIIIGVQERHDIVKTRDAKLLICIIAAGLVLASVSQSQGKAKAKFIGFKKEKKSSELPEKWEVLSYFRTAKNKLSLSEEEKRTILRVQSVGSASGILKMLEFNLKEFPFLVWRWKVNRTVGMAIETRKDRNDAAARIRVIFGKTAPKPLKGPPEVVKFFKSFGIQPGGKEPRGFKIDYIWGNNLSKGDVIDYPGSRNHKMVAVESGNKRAGRWVWEKRNLIEDFQEFFRRSPPPLIGIVVLTDTDQTNEGVIAHYSSIIMMSK
jgi:hypothetical protein